MARKWIKLYPEETFTGSTFIELNYKERYVWWGLLLMAGKSREDGVVMKRWDTGYTPRELAYELDCPVSAVKSALRRMVIKRHDEEVPKIRIRDNGIIEICNWHKYQSEYQRQKPYRSKGYNESYNDDSNLSCNQSDTIEEEVEIEEDIDIDNTPISPKTPYQKIKDLYNNICISLPKVTVLTDNRKKAISSRWKKYSKLEVYEELFARAEDSQFLSGKSGKWTSCNFDWLLKENNMVKVLEGSYDDR